MPRVNIYENGEGGPGLLGEFIKESGWSTVTIKGPELVTMPSVPDADYHVLLGSVHCVHDTYVDWIVRERQLVRSYLDNAVPVLGICFGAQMIAAELGGQVERMDSRYDGWLENPAADAEWKGPWLRAHEDAIRSAPGADILATDGDTIQGFIWNGTAVGVQAHPEVDERTIGQWMDNPFFHVEPLKSTFTEARQYASDHSEQIRARAFRLFDWIFEAMKSSDRSEAPLSGMNMPRT